MITETRATYNGVATRVLSVPGSGVPVVLLHGYADSADTWRGVLARLEALGQHAFAVDLPGFGRADRRRPGLLVPQFDAFADALIAEHTAVILVGNSLGAATAVRAAARHADRVKALVALDDPLNAQHMVARLAKRWPLPAALWVGAGYLPIPASVLRWAARWAVPALLYGPGAAVDPEVMAYWTQLAPRAADIAALGRDAFRYGHEAVGAHCGIEVGCPTAIVHGARDRIIPLHSSRTLHEQIPGSDLVILPRSGHCPQLDNPDEVTTIIAELALRSSTMTAAAAGGEAEPPATIDHATRFARRVTKGSHG